MAPSAQGNHVQILIRALLTAQLFVVDLQVSSRTADLTSPIVSLHDLLAKFFVQLGFQSHAGAFWLKSIHASWFARDRNCSRCSPGRNLKSRAIDCRSAPGSPLSRFAPARKSAQIISRQ